MRAYRSGSTVFAVLFVGIGVALLVEAATAGSGFGYLIGILFVLAGLGRLYLLSRTRRPPSD